VVDGIAAKAAPLSATAHIGVEERGDIRGEARWVLAGSPQGFLFHMEMA
jgi:hypothetical protein